MICLNSLLTDMDKPPTLNELMRFAIGDKHTDIISRIGQSYYKFGVNILEDDGSKMAPLDSQHRGDAERINTAVLTRWIRGEGRKPTSWATLATVLDECNLSPLAMEIRSAKGKSVQFQTMSATMYNNYSDSCPPCCLL